MRTRLPGFLAILTLALPGFLPTEAAAADVQIAILSNRAFRVSGGPVNQQWHVQYGSGNGPGRLPGAGVLSLSGPEHTAYFSHENWLRRIDTEKGVVTGRWHFPGNRITALAWTKNHLQVQVTEYPFGGEPLSSTIEFDPDNPSIPFWPTGSGISAGSAELETHCCRAAGFNDVAQANEWLAEAENTAHRDPLSPWLSIELAHIYKALGRPEAAALFEHAVSISPEDYSELLRISATLDDDGLRELARDAFERGYAAFWKRGMDPRLNFSLPGQLLIYPNPRKITESLRPELIDRRYRIGPWVESAAFAWDSYANMLNAAGKSQDAALWHERAVEARQNSLYMFSRTVIRWYETVFALVPAVHLAAIVFILALYFRYLPERRLQTRARRAGARRRFAFFNVEYWSRSDRIAFLIIGIVTWLSLGAAGALTNILERQASIPLSIGMGNLGGPAATRYLQNRLSPSPERDLILAIGYQQEAQTAKAEELYRQLPQFPESWNNLGVALQDSGKTAEAREAFEQALRLDPGMPDAQWNLNRKPASFWAELHQRFVPDRGMIAPPSREHFMQAFGVDWKRFAWQSLAGPVTGYVMMRANARFVIPRPFGMAFVLTVVEVGVAFLVLLVLPYRDVTQPAYRTHIVLEHLLPGTSPQWRQWGGIVLVAWVALLLQLIASIAGIGTIAFGGFPNVQRAFAVPVTTQPLNVFQQNAPYMLGGMALLYLFNIALIWRGSRTRI